ncbi:MAG: sugar kinase [Deltaproteobacteria bacterium]|nr:sugar kinase [Deltaproteobacteria bacterium]
MSWLIVGAVPREDIPTVDSPCAIDDRTLRIGGYSITPARGTPALLAAACHAAHALGIEPPTALIAGDTGRGDGSARLYQALLERLDRNVEPLMVFHYLQPDIDWHNRIFLKIEELEQKPIMVADAGWMYVAKMSGLAPSYDLFTPDIGELAFLADEDAPHPFYTRGFLLQDEEKAPELIERAYAHENAARNLLVKGRCDYIASSDGIIAEVCEPCVEAMEPIGGTGDSLTGIVAALIHSGRSVPDAARIGALANRMLGLITNPTPASSIAELLPYVGEALAGSMDLHRHI